MITKTFYSNEYYIKMVDMVNTYILERKKTVIKREIEKILITNHMIAANDIVINFSPCPITIHDGFRIPYLAYGISGSVEAIDCNRECGKCENKYICITNYNAIKI